MQPNYDAGFAIIATIAYIGFIRNVSVFLYRTWVLTDERFSVHNRLARFDCLPSYFVMLFQLFTFDWKHYLDDAVLTLDNKHTQ